MVIVMSKRFYILLVSIMLVSVVLLGFSYSKESGKNDNNFIAEINKVNYRVVFSSDKKLNTVDNSKMEIGIINKDQKINNFALVLSEVDNKNVENVYYSIDGKPNQLLVNGIIDLGELAPYGENGDFAFHTIEISSTSNYKFNMDVQTIESKLLSNVIKRSEQVYRDDKGNERYYGEIVDNYLRYNNHLYRIIGLIDGKIKLLDTVDMGLGIYNSSDEYPTLEDYLSSFDNKLLNIEDTLNRKSWMTEKRDYWLTDITTGNVYYASDTDGVLAIGKNVDLYRREVIYLEDNYYLSNGDGTINNPYEVTYGS